MRVLLIEDDKLLGDGILAGLTQAGHSVDWVQDGLAGETALIHEKFDAAVMDIGLPKKSGLEVLRSIRARGITTKVLILTARDAANECVAGLDAGADDYMAKPFDLGELYARLRALQRRSNGRTSSVLQHGALSLDPSSHIVTNAEATLNISRKEFALLERLLENSGRVLSREQLSQSLYSWDEEIDSNAVEVHIHNLRKKLGANIIRTVRGIGYIIDKEKSM